MREGTKTPLLEKGRFEEGIVKRATVAIEGAPPAERVRAGLQAAIAEAETDPAAARSALQGLRTDPGRLAELETWLGGDLNRATFGLGAAIQLTAAELACEAPDLEGIAPELLRWLEGDW